LGILPGIELRGWPSFDPLTFNLKTHAIDAASWPTTSSQQLFLAQTAALQYHYKEHVPKARLLTASSVLGSQRGPYSPTSVQDFLFDIIHFAMIPELRSFAVEGLKAQAAAHWNRLAASMDESASTHQEIGSKMREINVILEQFLTNERPFTLQ